MQLTRSRIAELIPHGSNMCLLDEVMDWTLDVILCRSTQFATSTNPLFENNQLDSILLIEYCAQGAAVHAGLLQSSLGVRRPALIGAVKNIELVKPFAVNNCAIDITAECLLNSSKGAIYEVAAAQNGEVLMRGRLILNQP